MFIKAKDSVTGITRCSLFVIFSMIFCSTVNAQDCPAPFTTLKQKKVYNPPGTTNVGGYLEHLPASYAANPTKKYPVIIYIHGVNESVEGTGPNLCDLLYEWNWQPPVNVELNKFPHSVKDQNGVTHEFILISPQLYGYFDASGTINSLINHLIGKYRIDESRIYLTGVSGGAGYINDYAGSSLANAKRVAGLLPVAFCGSISQQTASTIANGNLHMWILKCSNDGGCWGDPAGVVNAINSYNPSARLAHATIFPTVSPQPTYPCTDPTHNIWGIAYDTTFRQNVNGRLVNVFEWMVQFTNGTTAGPLPVTLKDFTARLSDGKVYLRWTTDAEMNSKRFSIERAGTNQQFIEVAGIPAAGISTGGKTYEWIDDKPLTNLSFYRLSQTDIDGEKQYFPIRKILNRVKWDRSAIVSPNPFTTDLSVYLNVEKAQRVTISLNDMNGKRLKVVYGMYKEGAAEVNVAAGNLPRGIYLLKIEGESFSETQKVLKQ